MNFKKLSTTFKSLLDSGIGPEDSCRQDLNSIHKLRAVNACLLLLILFSPLFAVMYLTLGSTLLFYVYAASPLACVVNIIFLRKTKNSVVASHMLAIIFITIIVVVCSKSGGFRSPSIMWLFLLPVGAGFAINIRSSILYGLVSGLIMLIFFYLHTRHIHLNSVVSSEHSDINYIVHFSTIIVVTVILIFGFLSAQSKTLQTLFISERKFRHISKQKEKSSRTKSEFLANMSHEIRTPMNGIIAMMHILLDTPMTGEQKKYANVVYNSANTLLTIINDILDFSKIEAGKLELDIRDFDLRVALEDMNTMFEMQAKQKNIDFTCTIEPDIPTRLQGDPGRIRQILTNLTGNAIKFTDAGEVNLHITLESDTSADALIRFSINDTGIGIPEEKIPALFDSFTQADASTTRMYGGTGLGLSISKMLVEKMSGRIGVESEELLGSTFWFTIHLEKQSSGMDNSMEFSTCIAGKKVLIISDSETSRFTLREQLISFELHVNEADNIDSAIRLLKDTTIKNDPFQVALVDMQLNGINAESLGKSIKNNDSISNTALVLLTSVGEKGDARRFEKAGFAAYLSKPVDKPLLNDCLKAILCLKESPESRKTSLVTRHSIAESRRHSINILIAEDNETNLIVANELLKRLGYKADSAKNGREAFEAFKNKRYDLILMDCQMPVMDGFQATSEIRKHENNTCHTPIIAMTANALKGVREKCLESGMDDYITKPVNPDELCDAIKRNTTGTAIPKPETSNENDTADRHITELVQQDIIFNKDEMLHRFGGDTEVIKIVMDSFLDESPELIEQIKKAALDKDIEALATHSHALKGSSANVNAPLLRKAALNMEETAKNKDFSNLVSLASTIENEFNKFTEEIS